MNEQRSETRLLCAQIVSLRHGPDAVQEDDVVLIDISSSGACIQLPRPVAVGSEAELLVSGHSLSGRIRYCEGHDIGCYAGIAFDPGVVWSAGTLQPNHLLDPRQLAANHAKTAGEGPDDLRDRLLAQLPAVRETALQVRTKHSISVGADVLIRSGILGLLSAIRKYVPGESGDFAPFANLHIRSTLLDSLKPGSFGSLEDDLNVTIPALDELAALLAARGLQAEGDEMIARAAGRLSKLSRLISKTIEALPAIDRSVIGRCYTAGQTVPEIAAALNMSETLIADIREAALMRIRAEVARALSMGL